MVLVRHMLDYLGLDTHSEYVMLVAFSWQRWLHKCTSVLRYA